jgi:hypothetical protein
LAFAEDYPSPAPQAVGAPLHCDMKIKLLLFFGYIAKGTTYEWHLERIGNRLTVRTLHTYQFNQHIQDKQQQQGSENNNALRTELLRCCTAI